MREEFKACSVKCKTNCDAEKYDNIFILGTKICLDDKEFKSLNELKKPIIYISPIEDSDIKNATHIKYEAGTEEGVVALLLESFKNGDAKLTEFLDELDFGYLSAECSVGEEEFEELRDEFSGSIALILGEDLLFHPKAKNLAKLFNLIGNFTPLKIIAPFMDEDINESKACFPEVVEELDAYDGTVVYKYPDTDEEFLYGSAQFAMANRLKNGANIQIGNEKHTRSFKLDENLKGTIGLMPSRKIDSYRFEKTKITSC